MEASDTSSEPAAPWATPAQSPDDTPPPAASDTFAERPEVFVGAAFASGLAVAGVLRWLSSR